MGGVCLGGACFPQCRAAAEVSGGRGQPCGDTWTEKEGQHVEPASSVPGCRQMTGVRVYAALTSSCLSNVCISLKVFGFGGKGHFSCCGVSAHHQDTYSESHHVGRSHARAAHVVGLAPSLRGRRAQWARAVPPHSAFGLSGVFTVFSPRWEKEVDV